MRKIFVLLVACAAMLLSGCQTAAIPAINKAINLGMDLMPEMQHRNISGVVAWDEAWAGDYPMSAKNQLYTQGVIRGTPEYGMRVVRVNIRHPDWGGWVSAGDKMWLTSAMVPDHMPMLKANDFVEIRQTGTWDVNKNFVATGEGNIIIRVLCRKDSPDWEDCYHKLPTRIGRHYGFGETGTLYPDSVKEYGYTFTPKYDAEGKPLR